MNLSNKIAIGLFWVLLQGTGYGQSDLSTILSGHLAQSSLYNPANLPSQKFVLSLPSVYFGAGSSGVAIQDILDNQNGSWINNLALNNTLNTEINVETLGLYFGSKKWKFGFHHAVRSTGNLDYSKDLAELVWFGNSKFIGKTIEIGPKIDFTSFHELGFAAAYSFANVTVGGRVKYLSGIGNASTERSKLSLETSDDIYQLKLTSDYLLNTSGAISYYALDSINFNGDQLSFNKLFGKNNGISFDLGVTLNLTKKLQMSLAVQDLGAKINWKDNVTNLSTQGVSAYNGLVLKDIIYSDSTTNFEHVLDSVQKAFNFVSSQNAYSSQLSARYMATASYKLTKSLSLNGLLFMQTLPTKTLRSFAIGAQYDLFSWLNIGANYAVKNHAPFNIGINATIKLGPVQVFALTDNVATIFAPYQSKSASGRIGLNIVLGKTDR